MRDKLGKGVKKIKGSSDVECENIIFFSILLLLIYNLSNLSWLMFSNFLISNIFLQVCTSLMLSAEQ